MSEVLLKGNSRWVLSGSLPGGELSSSSVTIPNRPTLEVEEILVSPGVKNIGKMKWKPLSVYALNAECKDFWDVVRPSVLVEGSEIPEFGVFKLNFYNHLGNLVEEFSLEGAYISNLHFSEFYEDSRVEFEIVFDQCFKL